jgi:hypothetical protein
MKLNEIQMGTKSFVWLTLWSLEFHRLRENEGKVAASLSWLGKSPEEIRILLDKYNESVAVLASSYANEAFVTLSNLDVTI